MYAALSSLRISELLVAVLMMLLDSSITLLLALQMVNC